MHSGVRGHGPWPPGGAPVKRSLLQPRHPERVCWGCDRFCSAADLGCGNGKDRVQHPVEVLGDDWQLAFPDLAEPAGGQAPSSAAPPGEPGVPEAAARQR